MFGDILSCGKSSLSSSVKSCESSSLSNSSVKTTVLDDEEEQIVKDQIGIKEEEIDKQFEFKREEFIDIKTFDVSLMIQINMSEKEEPKENQIISCNDFDSQIIEGNKDK